MAAAPKSTTTAVQAAEKEAKGEPTSFQYEGYVYTVPAPLDMPLAAFKTTDELESVELILNKGAAGQWDTFMATEPTLGDFQTFMELVFQASGQGDSGN
ncbi:hypothetical protein [Streptomyces luteireticuli]|uniref:Uncharacterized protein n=1 Tax=Streptomyces luteireticuli TaxID=173858 RepID=A0ABP3IJ33_9ACTN